MASATTAATYGGTKCCQVSKRLMPFEQDPNLLQLWSSMLFDIQGPHHGVFSMQIL